MAPSNQDTNAAAKQAALINFLYFLVPKSLLAREREKRILSPKAKKKRDAVNAIIYPFRPKPAPAPAPAPEEPSEVKSAPEGVKKKVKRVRFVLDESEAADEDDEMKGSSPK